MQSTHSSKQRRGEDDPMDEDEVNLTHSSGRRDAKTTDGQKQGIVDSSAPICRGQGEVEVKMKMALMVEMKITALG